MKNQIGIVEKQNKSNLASFYMLILILKTDFNYTLKGEFKAQVAPQTQKYHDL